MNAAIFFINEAAVARHDPQKFIENKNCLFCAQPATCVIINSTNIARACEKHGRRAVEMGCEVVFPKTEETVLP